MVLKQKVSLHMFVYFGVALYFENEVSFIIFQSK